MKKITLTALMIFMCVLTSLAQSKKPVNVTGRVLDSESGEAMIRCTVALMSEDTTKLISGAVTAQDGTFTIKNVRQGNYIFKVSYVGYHNFFRKHAVTGEVASHKMGTILLTPNTIQLEQAVVTGQLKEVEVKEDTLIFNAGAFKVPEGSVLEELIRKLPGVEVDENGTIKVNGKTVTKILVGGKEFFGNDKNMAMKNLPTEIIDKIKTYEKQSDLTRITGVDDGQEETVIDLSIKKGMKKGWFGNVDAAYGTRDRYAERASVNRFTDDFQASLIGNINNTNDRTGGGGGRGGGNGISTSGQLGGNIVAVLKKIEVGGNVRVNGRNTNNVTSSSSQNYVAKNSFSNRFSDSNNKNRSLAGDFKVEWKIDSMTTVLFRPNFSFSNSDSDSKGQSITFNADPYSNSRVRNPLTEQELVEDSIKVNSTESQSWSDGKNSNLGGRLLFNRRIKGRPWFGSSSESGYNGRNLSVNINGSLSHSKSDSYSYQYNRFFKKDSMDVVFRRRNTPNDNRNYSAGFTYSEPILRNLFAQVNYSYGYSKRHADGQTYDFGYDDNVGLELWNYYNANGVLRNDYADFLSDSLSRYTDNTNYTHNVEFSLRYITSLLNLSAGIHVEQQHQKMAYQYQGLDTVASRNISRVSPTLNARFRFSKQHTLRINYRGNSQQPEITDMFNLTDNSNAMNIRLGNPDLKPSFTNNLSFDYSNYFTATSQALSGRLSFGNTLNQISSRTEYNELTGGRITRPENINGNWNINGNVGFNTPLIWKKLTFNTNTSAGYRHGVSYLYRNNVTSMNTVLTRNLSERVTFTIRLADIDIRANGNINWSRTSSDMVAESNQNTYNFHYGLSSSGNFNNGFGYSTDIGMSSRRGYSAASMNNNELIWNGQVSYRFLKKRAATVSIQAYDILHQRSAISRNISATSRTDSEDNSIDSYILCHFLYRFNLFGDRQTRQDMRGGQERGPRTFTVRSANGERPTRQFRVNGGGGGGGRMR